jgi:hypothetical protein
MTTELEASEKTCTKCGDIKSRKDFYKRTASRDNLMSACKECVDANMKVYRRKNEEKWSAYHKKYRKQYLGEHREKVNRSARQMYAENREFQRARKRREYAEKRANSQD